MSGVEGMVPRAGIEPATRGFSVRLCWRFSAVSSRYVASLSQAPVAYPPVIARYSHQGKEGRDDLAVEADPIAAPKPQCHEDEEDGADPATHDDGRA